jgi:hypothetical protein
MKKLLLAFTIAAAGAAVARAQDIKSTTTTKVDDAQLVTYTGCMTSADSKSYTLENAIPMKEAKTETKTERSGDEIKTTTSGKYVLIPNSGVDFQKEVGQKVEVTAVLIPAGDDKTKIETKTETEVKGQPDRKTESTEKVAQTNVPQLRVMSVKHLGDRCTP